MRTSIYHPRLRTQLGAGTMVPGRTQGSRDCGVRTVQMGIDALTRGELIVPVDEIRRRMGRPGPQPTSTLNAERAVESFGGREMAEHDRRALIYDRRTGSEFRPHLVDAVKAGEPVQLAINYGTYNDLCRRERIPTGDPNFRGGHSVLIHGWRMEEDDVPLWLDFDSLNDGRRRGIPSAPVWRPAHILIEAWKDVALLPGGGEGCFFGIFRGGERTL